MPRETPSAASPTLAISLIESPRWPGHLYVGLRLDKLGVTMLEFGKEEKESSPRSGSDGSFRSDTLREAGIVSADFAGYERVLAALGKKAGSYVQEWTTKPKE